MMIGVDVKPDLLSTVRFETVTADSALNRTRTTRAIPSRNVLVVVTGVIVS